MFIEYVFFLTPSLTIGEIKCFNSSCWFLLTEHCTTKIIPRNIKLVCPYYTNFVTHIVALLDRWRMIMVWNSKFRKISYSAGGMYSAEFRSKEFRRNSAVVQSEIVSYIPVTLLIPLADMNLIQSCCVIIHPATRILIRYLPKDPCNYNFLPIKTVKITVSSKLFFFILILSGIRFLFW